VLVPAYNKITNSFPPEFTLKTKVEPPERVPFKPLQTTPAQAFTATYRAYCDLCKISPSKNFLIFAENRILAGIKELKFDECPGVELSDSDTSLDLTPVFMTLKHNKFFTKLSGHNVHRPDMISKLALCMEANVTLTELSFSQIGAEVMFLTVSSDRFVRKVIRSLPMP
jgi:hypothetical protein